MKVSIEVGITAASPVVAVIIGECIRRRIVNKANKWRRIWRSGNIPMWLVARAYEQWYSDKDNLPRRDLTIKGRYYIYEVRSKDKNAYEARAMVGNMIVLRRVRDDKK